MLVSILESFTCLIGLLYSAYPAHTSSNIVHVLQNLLLLPELGGAISNPNCNPVDATNTFHINNKRTALKLVNGETKNDSAVGSLPNGSPPRIVVSNLTASWTHVRGSVYITRVCITYVYV